MAGLWKCKQVLNHLGNFEQLLHENLWKDLLFLWHIFNLPVTLYMFTKFYSLKIFRKKNGDSLKMLASCYKFKQLWTTCEKTMKKPPVLMTYFTVLITYVLYDILMIYFNDISSCTRSQSFTILIFL